LSFSPDHTIARPSLCTVIINLVALALEYWKILRKMMTTTLIGVTGSFQTTTFHGCLVDTASFNATVLSVDVLLCVTVAPTETQSHRVWAPCRDPYAGFVKAIETARDTGEQALTDLAGAWRANAQRRLRGSLGLRQTPPPPCMDPHAAYLPVDGVARLVHGDLPSMLIGGVASLLLQMLHPLAMAGVAQHSRYRDDALGRLEQTATFIGTTTYGSAADAAAVIERVRAAHASVRGVADDGRAYAASDPHLLEWVHVAELSMFLDASRAYGPRELTIEDEDRYVNEMALVGRDLGVLDPPQTRRDLDERLQLFRSELEITNDAREARDFVVRGVPRSLRDRVGYGTVLVAAIGVLPDFARRQLELPTVPFVNTVLVRPAATTLCVALRWAVPPVRPA